MTANPSHVISLLMAFAIMMPILFLRMRRMRKGVKINMKKTTAFSALLLGFSAFLVGSSFAIGIPSSFAIAYVGIFLVIAYFSYHYSNKVLDFWRTPSGSIYAKGGALLLIFYFIALIARVMVSFTIGDGGQLAQFSNSLQQEAVRVPSHNTILAAIIVDGLLMVGAGLLIGRNVRIIKRYLAIRSGRETARDAIRE
jgi:hypothetical protein